MAQPFFPALNPGVKGVLKHYRCNADTCQFKQQSRYSAQCEGVEPDFALWTPFNAILPFQIYVTDGSQSGLGAPVSWRVFDAATNLEVLNLDADLGLLTVLDFGNPTRQYIEYRGQTLSEELPSEGKFFSVITTEGGNSFYSELMKAMCSGPQGNNIIENPNFADGLTGWTYFYSDVATSLRAIAGPPPDPGTEDGEQVINTADDLLYVWNGATWDSEVPTDQRLFLVMPDTWVRYTTTFGFLVGQPSPIQFSGSGACWDGSEIVGLSVNIAPGTYQLTVTFDIETPGTFNIIGVPAPAFITSPITSTFTLDEEATMTILSGAVGCISLVDLRAIGDDRKCHLKLSWGSCGNIGTHFFEDGYREVYYFDKKAIIAQQSPNISEDQEEGEQGQGIRTFSRKEVIYNLSFGAVPWFLLDALTDMELADDVRLEQYDDETVIFFPDVNYNWNEPPNDCLASPVSLAFQIEDAAANGACCETWDPPCLVPCELISGTTDVETPVVGKYYVVPDAQQYRQYLNTNEFGDPVFCESSTVSGIDGYPDSYFNETEWTPIAQFIYAYNGVGCTTISVTAILMGRYAGQLQATTDGTTWQNVALRTGDQWEASQFVDVDPAWTGIRMQAVVGECLIGTSSTCPINCTGLIPDNLASVEGPFVVTGTVTTVEALDALEPEEDDVYWVSGQGQFYQWNGTAWILNEQVRYSNGLWCLIDYPGVLTFRIDPTIPVGDWHQLDIEITNWKSGAGNMYVNNTSPFVTFDGNGSYTAQAQQGSNPGEYIRIEPTTLDDFSFCFRLNLRPICKYWDI